jgi:hypothetical protein
MAEDVDSLFPPDAKAQARDVDELFPADVGAAHERARARQSLGASPIQDMIFGDETVSPVARVLNAFGHGAKQNWGTSEGGLADETDKYLKSAGVAADYKAGQTGIIKGANNALIRPAAWLLTRTGEDIFRTGAAGLGALQAGVAQIGEEFGQPRLGREIAALPEAFPDFKFPGHIHLGEVTKARELGVIGEGEAGWKGTAEPKPAEVTPPVAAAPEAPAAEPGVAAPPIEPTAPGAAAAVPQPALDVHAIARQVDPETFGQYDELVTRRDTFRRWIDELRQVRDEQVRADAPHADEIADLQARLADEDTTPRLRKKYEARLGPLLEEHDQFIADATASDSADMAQIRGRLQKNDYAMRDLAPKVAAAYRQAQERMPAPEAVAAPAAATPPPAADTVRFFHGGHEPTSGGGRWVTPDAEYARNFRAFGTPNEVHYVDIPKGDAAEISARAWDEFDERAGTNMVGHYRSVELPEEWAKQLKPYAAPAAEPKVEQLREGALQAKARAETESGAAPTPVEPAPPHGADGQPLAPGVSRVAAAQTGDPAVDAVLNSPATRSVIERPVVDRSHRVPYGAGGSVPLEDPTVFIDEHVPHEITVKGKTYDPADPWILHENLEQHVMEILIRAGWKPPEAYRVAHWNFAEIAEGKWYEAHGIDKKAAEAAEKPILDKIQHEKAENVPANLYKKPYPAGDVQAARREPIAEARPSAEESARAREAILKWAAEQQTKAAEAPKPIEKPSGAPEPAAAVVPAAAAETPAVEPAAQPVPAPNVAVVPPIDIAADVTRQLVAAGRPLEEAQAAGALMKAYWEARAERFKGAKGTAQEMYEREGSEILGQGQRSQMGGARSTTVTKGPAARNPETYSLAEFLASKGGLKPDADLTHILGANKFIPGFGQLFRSSGMDIEQAVQAAKDGGYLFDAADVHGTEAQVGPNDLHTLLALEGRGKKQYRISAKEPVSKADQERAGDAAEAHQDLLHGELNSALQAVDIDPKHIGDSIRARTLEIMDREHVLDPIEAYERAVMEADEHAIETEGAPARTEEIPGWDIPHEPGAAPEAGRAAEVHPSETGGGTREAGAGDRETRELTQHAGIVVFHGSANDFNQFHLPSNGAPLHFSDNEGLASSPRYRGEGGTVYRARLDVHPDELLNLDKTLSQQSADVQDRLRSIGVTDAGISGYDIQNSIGAKRLQEAGIPGGSRDALGSHTYFIYDPERIEITHKNGEPVPGEPREFAQGPAVGPWASFKRAVARLLGQTSASIAEVAPLVRKFEPNRFEAPRRAANLNFGADTAFDWQGDNRPQGPLASHTEPTAWWLEDGNGATVASIAAQWIWNEARGNGRYRYWTTMWKPAGNKTITEAARKVFETQNAARSFAEWSLLAGRYEDVRPGDIPTSVRQKWDEPTKRFVADYQREHGSEPTIAEILTDQGERGARALEAEQRRRELGIVPPDELTQDQRGRIRLRDNAPATITLMKNADASTFIHETGHEWLDRLLRDAEDAQAPEDLKADAQTVLKWLGADSADAIKTRHHEKFARGFETYMMEGVAPSAQLAGVFAKFRDWLTKIYQTVKALKSPISDDIRDVFDRLLAAKPEKHVIAPEREPAKGFADLHEADAEATPPQHARNTADTIQAERDSTAAEKLVEGKDDRLADVAEGTGSRAPGSAQPRRDGNAPEPGAGPGGAHPEPGAVGAGGGQAADQGAGVSAPARTGTGGAAATEPPGSPNARFEPADTRLVDKAGNIRLDNLGTPEDVNSVIREAADANEGFIEARRGVISDAQILDLADALGMDASELSTRKLGQAFNAEQIIAARKLLIQSATAVRDAMAKAATGTDADVMAFAEARQRHLMIQEQVSGITAEAGRALRAFHNLAGQAEAVQIGAFLQQATGKTLYQMRRMAQLGSALPTPQGVSQFVRNSAKPNFGDMILEYWINALISGPATHTTYSVGNALLALNKAGPETAAAAAIGSIRAAFGSGGPRVYWGEVPAQLYGLMKGVRDGVVAAWDAARTGQTTLLPGELAAMTARQVQTSLMINPKTAIPDFTVGGLPVPLGTVIRLPSRGVAIIHSFFRAMNYSRCGECGTVGPGLRGAGRAGGVQPLGRSDGGGASLGDRSHPDGSRRRVDQGAVDADQREVPRLPVAQIRRPVRPHLIERDRAGDPAAHAGRPARS